MKKILSLLPRIAFLILFIFMAAVSLATAYIVFAPDTFPKPFYLVYDDQTNGKVGNDPTPSDPATAQAAAPGDKATQAVPLTAQLQMKPGQGIMLDTGSKIVNLVDPTGRKYLRVGVVLEFAPTDLKYFTMTAEEKKTFITSFTDDLNTRLPVINDVIITLLSSQTFESVYTAEGKEKLRKTIMDTINTQLPEHHVIFVYFTEFVVQ
jgi:flagellar basal body-associated protein FliL